MAVIDLGHHVVFDSRVAVISQRTEGLIMKIAEVTVGTWNLGLIQRDYSDPSQRVNNKNHTKEPTMK